MKILHVYKTYLPDDFTGVPRVIHTLAENTGKYGVENEVFTLSKSPSATPLKIGSHLVRQFKCEINISSSSFSVSSILHSKRIFDDADIIHYHFPWPMGDLLYLLRGRSKPSLVTYHSDIVRQKNLLRFYRPVMTRFLDGVDEIVATSPNYRDSSPVLARYKEKTSVIPIGLPERPAAVAEDVQRLRSMLGEGFLLFVGALRYYKGLQFLISAAEANRIPLVIAGGRQRGDIDVSALPENIRYIGEVSEAEKEALLTLCAGFVFPSHLRSEAFGISLAEAARAGKPMISCEIGTGTSFINKDGETGIVVPPADVKALSEAMLAILADEDMRGRMGRCAEKRFQSLFRADGMAADYLKIYQRLAGTSRG
ncbi:MAG: glycosyltransferase [Nitratireductor rhodophyticola]|uniref:glycosyltransferase n=1 Tax=Nitratireductor rhodophyticola TaxID=2854036 RepID=UPI0032D9802D